MGAVNLELVGGPDKPPATCMFCATNPRGDDGMNLPMVEAVGMDINWGETPYVCWTCCDLIADLVDRPDRAKVEAILRGAKLQKKHNEKLVRSNDKLTKAVRGLLDGADVREHAEELIEDANG